LPSKKGKEIDTTFIGEALLKTDQVYISRLECGKIGPTLPMIARIAECFKMTISELCDGV
jgi:transcriptional regulator with XRE-family HTH domain